ncbi:hypothetical protein ACFLUJ_03170 [Chloroflexota bacterium]
MENKSSSKPLESQYPSVDLAYEFVKPSYDWMLNRIEAMNSKIQGLLTLATAVTAAMPILIKAMFDNVDFQSVWFIIAIATYFLLVIIGIYGLRMGGVKLVNPKKLYERRLSESIWEFKKNTVYFSGQDFEQNKRTIDVKHHLRDIMNVLLLAELIVVVVWIVTTG